MARKSIVGILAQTVPPMVTAGAWRISTTSNAEEFPQADSESARQRLIAALNKLRPNEAAMRAKWIEDEQGWHKLPPRAWPPIQPKANEVPALRAQLEAAKCLPAGATMNTPECKQMIFHLASGLIFASVDPTEGFKLYQELGTLGDADAMVGTAICLLEGLGAEKDDSHGLSWLRQASKEGNAQADFELGTLLFTGGGGLQEDEEAAVALFQRAAEQQHESAMFMLADCLLEGVGCATDHAKAVPLLHAAAMKGHRGARQHLRQLLDGNWRGFDKPAGPVRLVV